MPFEFIATALCAQRLQLQAIRQSAPKPKPDATPMPISTKLSSVDGELSIVATVDKSNPNTVPAPKSERK